MEVDDWLQQNQERLLAELQKAVTQALLKLMQSLEQQCAGTYALLGGAGALGWSCPAAGADRSGRSFKSPFAGNY